MKHVQVLAQRPRRSHKDEGYGSLLGTKVKELKKHGLGGKTDIIKYLTGMQGKLTCLDQEQIRVMVIILICGGTYMDGFNWARKHHILVWYASIQ